MQHTVVRFRGELSPAILSQAGGLHVSHDSGVTSLTGSLSPSRLRALVDVLVATGHELVDVIGAPMERPSV